MSNQILQNEEIETLQSIYYPHEFSATYRSLDSKPAWKVVAKINVDLPRNYKITYNYGSRNGELFVNHLPTLKLQIYFGPDYPSKKSPKCFMYCEWLSASHLKKLKRQLSKVWEQNSGFAIVHTWIEYLKANTLSDLKLTDQLDITRVTIQRDRRLAEKKAPKPPSLIAILEEYNSMKNQTEFLIGFHSCLICFTENRGSASMLFEPCQHIFCRNCLRGYFTTVINDGNCSSVKCPAYNCETGVSQKQVRELLPIELFEKYDKLLLNLWFDTKTNVIYCPRMSCQYPASREGEDSMAVCPSCRYAFCVYCRMGYHGIESCKISAEDRKKLVERFQTATAEEKVRLELRYGKRQIENLVNNTLSEFWMEDNGQKCPKCKVVIEKSDGCNKMTCYRCGAFFCWLCATLLDRVLPYLHYQDPKSPCNNKLFQFVNEDEEEDWEIEELVLEDSGSEDIETDDPESGDEAYLY